MTASESDGNGNNNNNNNNNASVDRSSEISDSELFPEDDTGSEYVGLTSESETSDYTSAGEDFPLPRKIFMKKKSKPGAEASKLRGENLKTVACTATGRVQMLGSGALTPTEVFKTVTNKKIVDLIVTETNRNVRECKQKWVDVTEEEMWNFIAFMICMGLVKYP